MLRKLFSLMLSALLLTAGTAPGFAEPTAENETLNQPIVVEGEGLRVTSVYNPETDETLYTAELTNDPIFPDGTPVTAQDLLFSLYVYLDPGCSVEMPLKGLDIVGLESYVRQISQARLDEARATLESIRAAGKSHERSEDKSWSQELQDAYWTLEAEYAAACEREFPRCAQAIVDYFASGESSPGAFDMTAEEIAADEGLKNAYAMLNWGYANYDDGILTGRRSHATWNLAAGERPTLEDFVHELDLAYAGDLGRCWAVESVGDYDPDLPDVEAEFLSVCLGDERDKVVAVDGIRKVDDHTLEVRLTGTDMREAATLFSSPVLSLSANGDMDLWDPESGAYGHLFGDTAKAEQGTGIVLLEAESDEMSF